MRNSTMRFANKLCITIALSVLVICLATFAFVGNQSNDLPTIVANAIAEGEVTYLNTQLGLQYGSNVIRTTQDDFYGVDLNTYGGLAPSYSSSGLSVYGNGEFITKAGLLAGNTNNYANMNPNASVFYGILDEDVTTTFTYGVDIACRSASSDIHIIFTAYYSTDGSVGGRLEDTEVVHEVVIPAGTSNYSSTQYVTVYVAGEQNTASGSHLHVSTKIDTLAKSETSGSPILTFTNTHVEVSAESNQLMINANTGVSLSVSGTNRKTVTIKNVYSPAGQEALASLYVKEGDRISLQTALLDTNEGSEPIQNFSPYFASAFGRAGQSCIDWYTYYNNEYSRNKSYLARVEDEQHVYTPDQAEGNYEYKMNVYQGFLANFYVTDGVTNANTLQIIPRLIRSTNGASYDYWLPKSDVLQDDISNYQITINVDNTDPTSPKLDPTKTLGLAVANKEWYTASDSFKLDYAHVDDMDKIDIASEVVYAFIVDKGFTQEPSSYDFTPGNGQSFSYSAGAQGTLTTRRYELGDYSNDADAEKNNLTFNQAGEYGLILYAIDSAGNVSAPTYYTPNTNQPTVKVDARTLQVGAYVKYGNNQPLVPTTSNRMEITRYANIHVLAGPNYHDQDGNCTFGVNETQPNPAVSTMISVKRGIFVTVRIIMSSAQYTDYSLVRYAQGNDISKDNPSYVEDRLGNRIYDVTFKMDDDLWNLNATDARPVMAYFHRRVDLRLLDSDFTYTYENNNARKITFASRMQAYFATNSYGETIVVQPKIAVEYFKPAHLSIKSEFVTQENGQVILQGGATIFVNGTEYGISEDFKQNDFVRGDIPFTLGNSVYYCDSATLTGTTNEGGIVYNTYDLVCYDLSAGNAEGFADAGTYFYRAYVVADDSTHYYGEIIDKYTIKKADPGVIDAFAKRPLEYGQSFDNLVFASYDSSNNEITRVLNFGTYSYQQVSSGLFGTFVIQSPQIGSDDYNRHNVVNDYPITVAFRPIDLSTLSTKEISDNFEILKSYFTEVTNQYGAIVGYALKEGVQTAVNYEEVLLAIPVTVLHKSAQVSAIENTLEVRYDGYQKAVEAYVTTLENGETVRLDNQPLIIEYKERGADDATYTTTAPEKAGQYTVRIKIDSLSSNYVSDYTVRDMIISKRELEISVDESVSEHTILESDINAGNVSSNEMLTYTYSYTQSASYVAGYYEGEEFVKVSGLLYRYYFFKYAYYDQSATAVYIEDAEWSEPVDVIGGSSLSAGLYMMRVEVNNQNNSGEKYIVVDVKQVRRGDVASLSISTPSINTNYEVVDLNGVSGGTAGHLEYGQTLAGMRDTILGNGGSAKYTPRGTSNQISISSRFIFETEAEYVERIFRESGETTVFEMDTNGYGELVFPVQYNDAGGILPYSVRIIWQAGSEENGVFTPNYNFRAEEFYVPLFVVRARPDFSEYKLSTLTYGQLVRNAKFEGTISAYGYTFTSSDFTITIPTETLGYMPVGGENQILCNFTPSSALERKYLALNNVPIVLNVEKREVNITFTTQDITGEDYDGNNYQDVVTHVYGKQYVQPEISIAPVGASVSTQGLMPQFTYLRDYVEGEELAEGESLFIYKDTTYVKLSAITPSTPVGKYYVLAEIVESEQNFKGEAFSAYYVIKGTLYFNGYMPVFTIQYGDNLKDIDFGNVLVANDPTGNYNKYFYGTIAVAYLIEGEYVFDYIPSVYTNELEHNAYLIFTPTGSESVVAEYEKNFRPYEEKYFLRVDKRDLSDSFVIGGLSHNFDRTEKEITASVLDPVSGEELDLVISYLSDHTYAGTHQVEIRVDDSVKDYSGVKVVDMVINKAPLTIVNGEVEVIYNAKDFNYVPEYTVAIPSYIGAEFTFEISYRDYLQHEMTALPREIGFYYVDITLLDNNFYSTIATAYLKIAPSYSGFNGVEQTYSVDGCTPITPNYNVIVLDNGETRPHPSVNHRVLYKEEGLGEEYWSDALPVNAGRYDVLFRFDERSYVHEERFTMVVNKAEAVFITNRYYYADYVGEPLPLTVLLPESVAVANYFYKEAGSSDESYTQVAPTNAGTYEVKIVIDDINYKGEAYSIEVDSLGNERKVLPKYVVNKGDLEVKITPMVSSNGGNIRFNTPSSDVTFTYHEGSGDGVDLSDVQFPVDPLRVIKGKWVLVTDVSAYRVGERNVEIEFVPENENFNSVFTTINVNIIQRDLSEYITFEDSFTMVDGNYVISYEYTAEKIFVTPTLTIDVPYGENIYYTITYGDTTAQPINVLTEGGHVVGYPVTVVLSDANYSGTISNVIMYITPALDVEVVLPEFKSISVGDTLDNSYVVEASGGLYIKSTMKAVQGSFIIVEDYRVPMLKANKQLIEVQFVPSIDANNVSSPRVSAYINVLGQDLEFNVDTDITITGMKSYYGAPLSNYNIAINESAGVQASVEWANPNQIVNVGEAVEFILTPFDTDVYNVKHLYATIPSSPSNDISIAPAPIFFSADSNVILYEGNALRNAIPQIKLYNGYLSSLDNLSGEQEAVFEIKDYEYTISGDDLNYVATSLDLGKYLEGKQITITITHPNYETTSATFDVFVKRLISDFNVASKHKFYDGEVVEIADLGVSLIGTNYIPHDGDVVFKNIVLDGKSVSEIRDAGTYTVTIAIVEDLVGENGTELNGSHEGEYTFTYVVEKRDLSEYIDAYFLNALNERVEFSEGTTYAEYVDFAVRFASYDEEGNIIKEYEVDRNTVQFTHYSSTMAYSYGTLPPTDAGNYNVVVSLRDNPYYVGSKTFAYSILKRVAEISVDAGYYYTYSPVSAVNIVPVVSNNVSSEYVQITYYPTGSNIGTTEKPVNVGSYNVVINIVNHPNMSGSATTLLNISTAPVVIEELPVIKETLKYGTMLKHAGIEGGVAEATGGEIVSGTFSFMYPETNDLPVGTNNVTLVFTPNNSNYGTTTCLVPITIVKALLNVEFLSLETDYTGSPMYPAISLDENVRVNYTFKLGNLNVQNAINAGVYEVTVNITDSNYEGSTTATFTIHKAKAIEELSTAPALSPVTYGTALKNGTIEGGSIVYVQGKGGVLGSFRYLEQDTILGDVGIYSGINVLFTPADTANYETYIFPMDVEVVKANAVISVSANTFVYGEAVMSPVFTTSPQGLKVDNSEFEDIENGGIQGTIQRTGTYLFTAYINEKNYKGEIKYAIIVDKKPITVAFYRENIKVDSYTATYGNTYYAKAQIVADTLVGDDLTQKTELEKLILYRYVEYDEDGKQISSEQVVPPSKRGYFKVTATMEHNDYYISGESATVNYTVTKATVNSIEFDLESLSGQVYGKVSTPIVITSPANVGYHLEFPGYASMPTGAGNYSIKVTIQDDNYYATTRTAMFRINPKEISVEELKAYNKSYDGLSDIEVVGELKGVMSGDEVGVKLFAHTRDNKVNVGAHSVVINSWELYGLHAKNYTLRAPLYNLTAKITNKVITDPNTQSYITSPDGFSSNITVSFQEVYDTIDNTNFFTQMIGQKATVQVISVKENGLNTVLDSKVKFYVLIPEEYRNAKNLTVQGLGNLENAVITREGDYVTFYADSSGEIIFYKNDFPYWVVIAGAVVLMLILGGVFALIALPIRRRKRIPKDARSAYVWNQNADGKEHAFRKQVEQEIVEKKRRWRY